MSYTSEIEEDFVFVIVQYLGTELGTRTNDTEEQNVSPSTQVSNRPSIRGALIHLSCR